VTVHELIGATAADLIAEWAKADEAGDGTARFLLDRLTDIQVGEICRAVLAHPELANRCRLRIPVSVGQATGLPADALTVERTTYWRNQDCDRPVLLLANTDDDQGQSLKDVTPIGSNELLAEARLWVARASMGLALSGTQKTWWEQALRGLQDAKPMSLDAFAEFVLETRHAIQDQGLPIVQALGWALPAIRAPRDSAFFNAIPLRALGHASRWRTQFSQVLSKRAVYLVKVLPTQQPIGTEQLREMFQKVRSEIDERHHPVFERFIEAEAGWGEPARALAALEWELDKVKALFDGLRAKPDPLGKLTLDFYDDEYPQTLSDDEREQLERIDKRKTREANEDDLQFYERHRHELARNRQLLAKWDRFVYGQPLETDDFLVGLLRVLERLFERVSPTAEKRRLIIESHRRKKQDWLDVNYDAATYFGRRYRGIQALCGPDVTWEVPHGLDFDKFIRDVEARGKYERNRSTRRSSLQLKFTIRLETTMAGQSGEVSSQLVWTFNPHAILSEYHEDWLRVAKNAFCRSRVTRELVSTKGRLQSIDLNDVTTLMPVFRQDRGSLVAAYDKNADIDRVFRASLDDALASARITPDGAQALVSAWSRFSVAYRGAVQEFVDVGLAAESCISLATDYEQLLEALSAHARGDRNRVDLLDPVLRLGVADVEGGEPAAIVAPWHPLRIVSTSVKARYVGGLIRYLLKAETVNFGDTRLFFQDISAELRHVYYPEVCVGNRGTEPELLAVSEVCGEYSLMESPTRRRDDGATTNEDPREAAGLFRDVVRRYLELQPHESANFTTVLYNCDTAKLPQEVVAALAEFYEEQDEVRFQVVLRHNRPEKLNYLYETLLETSERDADSLVASEASRDFMARLRIGIMADQAAIPSALDGPPADIVFLQDVIARLAEARWTDEQTPSAEVDILHHIPPRWSRRRAGMADDEKTITYLACPVQPSVGWSYLRAARCLLAGEDVTATAHPLPCRLISFRNNDTREIFEEVHRLGQWVVNHDELLTRRLLRSLKVQVIRFQQHAYEGRSLIISSKAPLNLLSILVQKRLLDLNLGLSATEISELAGRMIDDANEISGDIVLRAAKRACFASELVGVALSRFLLEDEIGAKGPAGWYFLDDYAEWLGQKQQHIADILALSPQLHDGKPTLVVLLSEAKYIDIDGLATARRSSEVQLRETQTRIQEAIFGDPGRLDRDLWLARLADLLLDGVEVAPTSGILLHQWRDAVRDGRANVAVRGYSHVFVHRMAAEDRNPSQRLEIGKVEGAWQEVYGRDEVRDLVLAYFRREPARSVRTRLGDYVRWDGGGAPPAPRVKWIAPLSGTSVTAPPSAVPAPPKGPRRAGSSGKGVPAVGTKPPVVLSPRTLPLEPEGAAPTASGAEVSGGVAAARLTAVSASAAADYTWASPTLAATLRNMTKEPSAHDDAVWLSATVTRLRSALLSYSLQAKLIDSRLTPNTALIRLQGSDRLRVSDLEARREQLLTTHELRVVRVSAEPGRVVVAVARPERETVSLVNVLRRRTVDDLSNHVNQSLVVGVRESDGSILYLSPGAKHAPHTLIAGTTGSGKSILLQNLILDIGMTNSPRSARITLIDPKQGVDYFMLEHLPHLDGGIIVEQAAASGVLDAMVVEMDARYRRFREARATNLADYNLRAAEADRLPIRWIIHDEFAEWMLADHYRDVVSNVVQRLGVKARAAGIFLIFAAQRPEDRVMPVQLRDNLGNRLILKVESEGTSRISLGEEGAERLLGKGHLAARLQGEDDIVVAQVPILESSELERLVQAVIADANADGRSQL
jgi:S-DNA-T family DNA segregation ATPase FtsK/SpoIIIE